LATSNRNSIREAKSSSTQMVSNQFSMAKKQMKLVR